MWPKSDQKYQIYGGVISEEVWWPRLELTRIGLKTVWSSFGNNWHHSVKGLRWQRQNEVDRQSSWMPRSPIWFHYECVRLNPKILIPHLSNAGFDNNRANVRFHISLYRIERLSVKHRETWNSATSLLLIPSLPQTDPVTINYTWKNLLDTWFKTCKSVP